MRRWAFLLRPGWLALALVAVAFAYLALVGDKKEFLGYVPLGLEHLRAGLRRAAALRGMPALSRLRETVEAVAARLQPRSGRRNR